MDAAIETVDLKKTFPAKGRGQAVEAVRGVSLNIARGEIFGFLGPNGAGKTTCQRMLTTLLPISSGTARVAGFDVAREPGKVRRHIGAVGQLGGSDGAATGRENLMLSARLYGISKRDARRRIDEVSELLDLGEPLDRVVSTWSGGQKRRLEIALGIMHEPEVLFMDEPSTGLDPQNRANLWTHITGLKERGMTIFLTTHYLEEADALADRLAIIDHGRIVAEGTPEDLKARVSPEEVACRIRREVPSGATLDDVFFKICGRRLRDAEADEEE